MVIITSPTGGDGLPYRPRNYQYEMFEASLKENIIVAVSLSQIINREVILTD
jgi:hypothetical protein